MAKYIIEGGIDFYSELYKSLDDDNDQAQEQEQENQLCLITYSPLIKNFVTLDCNHKFNYIPLYNDILNHKKKYNAMERQVLKSIEIRCPYCRHVQNNLLPYYEDEHVKKVHGVNFFDESLVIKRSGDLRDYVEGECCVQYHAQNGNIGYCLNTHVTLIPENNKYYCVYHKYYGQKEAAKELKIKEMKEMKKKMMDAKQKLADEKAAIKSAQKTAQESAKLAKQSAKIARQSAKIAKQSAKIAKQSVKQSAKQSAKQSKEPNISTIVINDVEPEPELVIVEEKCCQILKSGPNKGGLCGLNIFQDNLCKRHHKSTNNNNNIVKNIET